MDNTNNIVNIPELEAERIQLGNEIAKLREKQIEICKKIIDAKVTGFVFPEGFGENTFVKLKYDTSIDDVDIFYYVKRYKRSGNVLQLSGYRINIAPFSVGIDYAMEECFTINHITKFEVLNDERVEKLKNIVKGKIDSLGKEN